MGGLYFILIGVGVVRLVIGFWFIELWGVCVVIFVFVVIGFVDDWLVFWWKYNYGMLGLLKFLL